MNYMRVILVATVVDSDMEDFEYKCYFLKKKRERERERVVTKAMIVSAVLLLQMKVGQVWIMNGLCIMIMIPIFFKYTYNDPTAYNPPA